MMMNKNAYSLLSTLPPIRRSRGFRLYSRDGRRFLDFWQEGGAGILGSRSSAVVNSIKSDLEAGRFYRLPSDGSKLMESAVLRIFPGFSALRCYPNLEAARAAIVEAGFSASDRAEWKPFLPIPVSRVLLVRPPLPESLRPAILLFQDPSDALVAPPGVPAGFQPRAAVRALCDIRKEETDGLSERQAAWELFDSQSPAGLFTRNGPYLAPVDAAKYPETFAKFLAAGVLLSPDPEIPSIVPGNFERGELSFLKEETR
jgi:hypothetical protein